MGERIGLVGIGLVGTALAERLVAAGYGVLGYDIVRERCEGLEALGGVAAESAEAVGARCERVILSLLTSEQVREVVSGLLEADPRPSLILDTTTGDPRATEALAGELVARGIRYVDSTISGSSVQVRDGEALYMLGGRTEDVAAWEDVLAALTERWRHVGPSGSGSRMKLVVNLILGLNRAALAEGLAFAETMDLDLGGVVAVLEESMAYSRIMDTKARKMVEGDYSTQARLSQHRKDVATILDLAERLGQGLPLSEAHLALLDSAIEAGDADLDNSALMRELQRRRKRDM